MKNAVAVLFTIVNYENETHRVRFDRVGRRRRRAEVSIRIRFGLNEKKKTKWDGSVAVAPNRIAVLDGWRFMPF